MASQQNFIQHTRLRMQPGMLSKILLVTATVLMTILLGSYIKQFFKWEEVAYGCDAFGYMRQAELFRKNGFIKGLNTEYHPTPNERIIEVALSSGLPSKNWGQAVAPHCHHFDTATKKIILQYPPLTGLFLAAFDEPHQVRYLLASVAVLLGCVISFLMFGRFSLLNICLCVLLYAQTLFTLERSGSASYSIITSILLIGITSILLAGKSTDSNSSMRTAVATFIGIGLGLATTARTANVLLVASFIPFIVYRFISQSSRDEKQRALLEFLLFVSGFLAGSLPLLAFNQINAGSPFSTTYDTNDSNRAGITVERITDNAQFYFLGAEAPINLVAPIFILLMLILLRRRRDKLISFSLITAPVFITATVFFLTHPVRTTYYLAASNFFISCFGVAFWCMAKSEDNLSKVGNSPFSWKSGLIGSTVFAITAIAIIASTPLINHNDKFREAQEYGFVEPSFLWADIWGGAATYYGNVPTAKMVFLWDDDFLMTPWIKTLSNEGYNQYFLRDTENAGKFIDKIARNFCLVKAPKYRDMDMYIVAANTGHIKNHDSCLTAPQ